jgi:hypothetical protein
MKYALKCAICSNKFSSFEKYESHIIEAHKDRLDLRMKPEIVRVD